MFCDIVGSTALSMQFDREDLRELINAHHKAVANTAYLAAAEALVGDVERAKVHLAKLDELDPGMTIRRFVEERSSVPLDAISPVYRRENERILDGLRRAGMPDA